MLTRVREINLSKSRRNRGRETNEAYESGSKKKKSGG